MKQLPATLKKINFLKVSACIIQILFCKEVFCQASDSVIKAPDTIVKRKIYHVSYVSGSIIILGGLLTDYPAIGRIKSKPDITPDEINALNPGEINFLDKWGLQQPTSGA